MKEYRQTSQRNLWCCIIVVMKNLSWASCMQSHVVWCLKERVGHEKWSTLRTDSRGSKMVAKNDVRQLTSKRLSSFVTWKYSVEFKIYVTSTYCKGGTTKAKTTIFSAENDTVLNNTTAEGRVVVQVTNHFVIRFKGCFTRESSQLVL